MAESLDSTEQAKLRTLQERAVRREKRKLLPDYTPQALPQTRAAGEMYKLLKETDWQLLKRLIESPDTDSGYKRQLMVLTRRLDPNRFDAEIGVSNGYWQSCLHSLANSRVTKGLLLATAKELQDIDPTRFAQDVQLTPEDWEAIKEDIRTTSSLPMLAIKYQQAQSIDPDGTYILPLPDDQWLKLRGGLLSWDTSTLVIGRDPVSMAVFTTLVQAVKPSSVNLPDIKISLYDWDRVKNELEVDLEEGLAQVPWKTVAQLSSVVMLKEVVIDESVTGPLLFRD